MSVTIHLDGTQNARVSDQHVETHPPDRIEFVAEGVVRVSEALLSEFEGTTMEPRRVGLSVDDTTKPDGGPSDVLLDVTLLGYGVVVRRDGTVEIGTR